MPKLKLIAADSAALTASSTATVMTKSDATTYELVWAPGAIPVDSLRGCILRIKALVHATATNSTDTLAALLQVGKTGTMTTVASAAAYDNANDDIHLLEADIIFRSTTAFYAFGRAQYTGLTAPQLTTVKSTTYDPASAFRVQVKCTWSSTHAGNSCKVAALWGEFLPLDPNVTAALS